MFSRKKKEGDAAKEDDSESSHGFSFLKKSKYAFAHCYQDQSWARTERAAGARQSSRAKPFTIGVPTRFLHRFICIRD